MTLDVYAEPFAASGAYRGFGELSVSRGRDLRMYGTDGTTLDRLPDGSYRITDGASTFTLSNRDFNRRSFRSNVVLRWEWRPGQHFLRRLAAEPFELGCAWRARRRRRSLRIVFRRRRQHRRHQDHVLDLAMNSCTIAELQHCRIAEGMQNCRKFEALEVSPPSLSAILQFYNSQLSKVTLRSCVLTSPSPSLKREAPGRC